MFYPNLDRCSMEPGNFPFIHLNSFFFSSNRSNLQRWEELANERPQLTRTNLISITAGTSTDETSDSSRTPPANNIRQPAST